MNISSLVNDHASLSQASLQGQVSTLVLKKAIDLQAESALQLLQTVPQVASNPPNLGGNVDVRA